MFTSEHQTFAVYLRSDMSSGVLIMTNSRPILRTTYEVILHPPRIWLRKIISSEQSNPGPFSQESSADTTRPRRYPNVILQYFNAAWLSSFIHCWLSMLYESTVYKKTLYDFRLYPRSTKPWICTMDILNIARIQCCMRQCCMKHGLEDLYNVDNVVRGTTVISI